MRRASAAEDAKIAQSFKDAHAEAAATLAERRQKHVDAQTSEKHLEERLAAGDESVTETDLSGAAAAIKRAKLLLPSAEAECRKAECAVAPWLADNHLAYLAADVMTPVIDVPIIHRKRASDAPELSPAIILSQVTPTEGYGTLDASGEVEVTVVGEADIDWRVVQQAFDDAGCEASASENGIVFDQAAWPVPRLSAPSSHALALFSRLFMEAWTRQIEYNEVVDHLMERGYKVRPGDRTTGLAALSQHLDSNFTAAYGEATGTVRFRLATDYLDAESLATEVEALIGTFRTSIGNITDAGEITDLSLVSLERANGSTWDRSVKYGETGHPLYPATVEIEVEIKYAYEPANLVEIVVD